LQGEVAQRQAVAGADRHVDGQLVQQARAQERRGRRRAAADLSPPTGMPLKALGCGFRPGRPARFLRSIKSPETINGKPAGDSW